MDHKILALGGDGIGPEVLDFGLRLIYKIQDIFGINIKIEHDLIGGACWDKFQVFCKNETVEKAKNSDAILVGAVGGPKWDNIKIKGTPEEQDGLMRLRKELDAYLGIRPAKVFSGFNDESPIKEKKLKGTDILVLREMTSGIMFAQPRGNKIENGLRYAFDTAAYREDEIERFVIAGFDLARKRKKKICSIDKANVMESYKLWRDIVNEVSKNYSDVELNHYYADNCAYQLIMNPSKFDIILGCNLLGDIFSDLVAVFSGGLGLLPSACLCGPPKNFVKGIYEPVHGSAPDIAGTGKANPIGMFLSIAMMFEYSFERKDISTIIEKAIDKLIYKVNLTPDLNGKLSTEEVFLKFIDELNNEARV